MRDDGAKKGGWGFRVELWLTAFVVMAPFLFGLWQMVRGLFD